MTKTRCAKCGGVPQLIGLVMVTTPVKGVYVQYKCSKCGTFTKRFIKQDDKDAKEQEAS